MAVALVTGAEGGIGRAIVAALAGAGWTVAGSDLPATGAEYSYDLRDPAECRSLIEEVVTDHGGIDLLVNNAASMTIVELSVPDMTRWWQDLDVNLSAPFRLVRAAAESLRKSRGQVINIASVSGVRGEPGFSAYAASKAGLIGLTKSLARPMCASTGGTRPYRHPPAGAGRRVRRHHTGRAASPVRTGDSDRAVGSARRGGRPGHLPRVGDRLHRCLRTSQRRVTDAVNDGRSTVTIDRGGTSRDARREEILAVATRLFAENGYANTTMTGIAKACGLRQPSLYYWFTRKEHILNEVLALNRVSLDFVAELGAQPGSAALRLYRLLHFDTYQLCLSPLDISEVERLAERQPEAFDAFWGDTAALHDHLIDLVRAGVDQRPSTATPSWWPSTCVRRARAFSAATATRPRTHRPVRAGSGTRPTRRS
jgi:AcrR family transcriptional regulator